MIRVICAGGTGSNIGKQISDLDINVCYVDTSTSNLKGVGHENIFLIPDIDGAGKNRNITYDNFKDIAGDVLIKFKPSNKLNVVVSSLSGGSGSIIGPMVVKELIKEGYNTIVIAVDSKHSVIELNNTIKTLKTYKSISDSVGKSISMFYVENNSRKEADQQSIRFINLLSLIVNKEHTEEFDVTDLGNFINFSKVTDNKPSVSVIEINPNEDILLEKNTSIVSSILVTVDKNTTIHSPVPEYLSTCIVTDKNYKNEDIRIDNVLGKLAILVDHLDEEIKTHQDNKKINKIKDVEVNNATSDGIVL